MFYHEFAHHLYDSPHYFGANGVVGDFFFNTRGWGMMTSGASVFNSANAWERWLLNWIELDANGVNSDIQSVADLPPNGTFVLRDFIETGDVVRIKIPNTTNQYVWLENRTGATVFDDRNVYVTNGLVQPLPQAPRGLVMFISRMLDDKNVELSSDDYDYVNGLSVIHSGGNWDFSRSASYTTPQEWWGTTKCYDFSKSQQNPLTGIHTGTSVRDDFYTVLITGTTDYSTTDDIINYSRDWNRGGHAIVKEFHDILIEDGNFVYGLLLTDIAFEQGDKISVSTNPAIKEIRKFSHGGTPGVFPWTLEITEASPIYLHNLSIEVLQYFANGDVEVKVSFDDFIAVESDIRWCGNPIILPSNQELRVLEDVTLTIDISGTPNRNTLNANGNFFDPTVLIIENDAILKIENNSEIIVKNNSTLILEEGSLLQIENGGRLIIEETGNLIFNGGEIELVGNNSIIEIAGDLHIAQNATFTFSGDGYIVFNKPGTDAADGNIFAESGASFVLAGTGKFDKKMEVQQSTLRFPTLAELRFESCKIEMGAGSTGIGARMQTTTSTNNITFDDVLVTSDNGQHNNHRSFHFYGQSNVTINDCIFEYGREGLKGTLNYVGNTLDISNSTFRYNTTGIEIDRKGLNLQNCNVYDNTLYGIVCQDMDFSSSFNSCYVYDNSSIGIVWTSSSTANLTINSSLIENHTGGIFADGPFSLDLNCTHVNSNFYGIFMANGAILSIMSNSENNLTENDYTVYYAPYNYGGRPFLHYGHNQLQAKNDGYTFTGAVNTICFHFMGGWVHASIYAINNRWEQNTSAQPQLNVNHALYSYNCNPNPILTDISPDFIDCQIFLPMGGEGGDSEIDYSNDNIVYDSSLPSVELSTHSNTTIDEAIAILRNTVSNANSESEFVMIIADYINIINTAGTSLNVDAIKLIDIAYSDMMHAISEFYAVTNYNRDNSSINLAIDDVKSLNSLLLEKDFVNDIKFFEYKLNNALLERFRDQYDVSISELIQIINDITVYQSSINSENDYLFWDNRRLYVDRWLCVVRIEKEFFDGIITIDEYAEKIRECGSTLHLLHEKMDTKSGNKNAGEIENDENSDNFEMESQINSSEFYVTPNPNSGSFSVYFYAESNNNKLKIFNTLGQEVETRKINEIGDQTVVFEGFAKGQYTIVYISEDKIIKTRKIIVK